MSAMTETREVLDWEREAIDLKRQGLTTNDIAAAVDRSAPTVRKAVAKARERGDLPADTTDAPMVVQTTVDDFTTAEVPPEDDPEYEPEDVGGEVEDFELPEADPEASAGTHTCAHGVMLDVGCDECDRPDVDALQAFKDQAGEAVGDMPPVTPPEPGETSVTFPVLKGTRQLAIDFGPNAAPVYEASVKFASEKWPSGHFGMGDVVTGTFTARIVGVPAKESFDKDLDKFVAKPLTYGALITEIEYVAVDDDA